MRHQDDWIALVLGVALLPIALELTCYYYAILFAIGLLWIRHRWIGVALALSSALTDVVPAVLKMDDDMYAVMSAGIVIFVAAVTISIARADRVHECGRAVAVLPGL